MWGLFMGWVWLLLSLTMVGILALAVLSIPALPGAPLTPAGGTGQPEPQAPRIAHLNRAATNPARAPSSVHDTRPRREARHE